MDRFHCVVCLEKATNPRLCPKCAKFLCYDCLIQTYNQTASNWTCPHCRTSLDIEDYVKVPWAEDHQQTLETLTPQIADKCNTHPLKHLSVFCADCDKSVCADCWKEVHESHRIQPLEAAHKDARRGLEDNLIPPLEAKKAKLSSFRRETLRKHKRNLNRIERDGEARIDEVTRNMREAFKREMEAMKQPVHSVEAVSENIDNFVSQVAALSQDRMLNRLVDGRSNLMNGFPNSDEIDSSMSRITTMRKSILNFEALQIFTPWLPNWDIKEKVVVKECKRILSYNTSSKSVARFTINDVTWNVCLANRSDGVCDTDDDDTDSSSSSSSVNRCDFRFPESLMMYVTMEGRDNMKNYELAIEAAAADDKTQRGSGGGATSGGEEDNEGENVEAGNNAGPVRCVIVRRDTFRQRERLYFPITDPREWINDKEELVFFFMIRPLTYQQKCEDQEIYYKNLLAKEKKGKGPISGGRCFFSADDQIRMIREEEQLLDPKFERDERDFVSLSAASQSRAARDEEGNKVKVSGEELDVGKIKEVMDLVFNSTDRSSNLSSKSSCVEIKNQLLAKWSRDLSSPTSRSSTLGATTSVGTTSSSSAPADRALKRLPSKESEVWKKKKVARSSAIDKVLGEKSPAQKK